MWFFKRGPSENQIALAEFREQVDDVIGRALAPFGLRRFRDPQFLCDDVFEEAWYMADMRAVRIVFSIHFHDGPAHCSIDMVHKSSRFDSALGLRVPISDYITSNSGGTTQRTSRDYLRKTYGSTTALLEFVRNDLLQYCAGFLKGDFEEFKRLYNIRVPDWTWRTE